MSISRIVYTNGEIIGNCTFIQDEPDIKRQRRALFKCVCGKPFSASISHVKRGGIKSCGCMTNELRSLGIRKHGACLNNGRTKEYTAWSSLKARCTVPTHAFFPNYGGRGITVCQRWLESFDNFLEDMGLCSDPKLSIERIDNNKGYSKENCKWGTKMEQLMNRRNTKLYEYNGEKKSLKEWSIIFNISEDTLWGRVNKIKMPFERAITLKIREDRPDKKKVYLIEEQRVLESFREACKYLNVGVKKLRTMLKKKNRIILYSELMKS